MGGSMWSRKSSAADDGKRTVSYLDRWHDTCSETGRIRSVKRIPRNCHDHLTIDTFPQFVFDDVWATDFRRRVTRWPSLRRTR